MLQDSFRITQAKIKEYTFSLKNDERADNTVQKYIRDIRTFTEFLSGKPVTKEAAIEWKIKLRETHAVTSINSMIAAVNSFFAFYELGIKIKPYKIQRSTFLPEKKDLSKAEYERLLKTAKSQKNERLFHVIQTICATGIRVGELEYITAEAVKSGQAQITNKGKTRIIFIPCELRKALLEYIKKRSITSGCIFITKSGKPLNRSNIWAEMKNLCKEAEVDSVKVCNDRRRSSGNERCA